VGALAWGGVTLGPWLTCLAFGACLWTAVEYVVHRWLLHGVMARAHARHHDHPLDARYLHGPLSAWAITVAASLAGLTLGLGIARGLWAFVGLNVAYVVFELTHVGVHADFRAGWFRPARRFHAAHHFAKVPGAFGFSTPFWDWVLGTMKAAPRFPRWVLWAVPLPLPLVHFVLASFVQGRTVSILPTEPLEDRQRD